MSIESDIFKKCTPSFDKISLYGFIKKGKSYFFEQLFKEGEFKAVIEITASGGIIGTVYDMENGDEFLPLRVETQEGAFVGKVREEYEKILVNIRENCFSENYFIFPQTNRIASAIINKYGIAPVFMWKKFPNYGVFKNNADFDARILFVQFSISLCQIRN